MSDERVDRTGRDVLVSSERAKAFVDAVVAIAMTLLILPLMESVADLGGVASGHLDAGTWLGEHGSQLGNFVLSFVIIAMFWINHHRLFAAVERVSAGLLWINMAWLLSIVWLPVATALVGTTRDADPVAAVAYVGTMILTSMLLLTMRLFLHAHPGLHDATESSLRNGISVDLSMILLFGVALTLILATPIGYWAMLIMFLTGPMQALFSRLLHVSR